MSKVLHVFGASDDLIEIEGAFREEFYLPSSGSATLHVLAEVENGVETVELGVSYSPDDSGEWRVVVLYDPDGLVTLTPAPGEDENDSDDADGCPPYSDKATVRGGYTAWVVGGDRDD